MAKGNDGNYLQNCVEVEAAMLLTQNRPNSRLHVALTHGMAPFEKIENPKAQKNSNVQKKLLCNALVEAAGEPKCDEREIVKAYRASWESQVYRPKIENLFDELETDKHYPNSAELLRAAIGTTRLSGGITECNKAKHAELEAAWNDSKKMKVECLSWRKQLKPGGVLSCPKSLDVPWLFSMDPMSYKENGSEDDEYLHHSDLDLLKPSLHTYFKSGKPGVACFFVYNLGAGGENQQGKFCSFINEIAEHIGVNKRFYSVPHNGRKVNIASLLYNGIELALPSFSSVTSKRRRPSGMNNPIQKNGENSERRLDRIDNWLKHAKDSEVSGAYEHISFLFHWIAYEAAYQQYKPEDKTRNEYEQREEFHENIAECENAVNSLQIRLEFCKEQAENLLALRQSNRGFWRKLEGWGENPAAWEKCFERNSKSAINNLRKASCDSKKIPEALNSLFDNLSIVRHQIVHGGSSGESSLGKHQVTWGNEILKRIIPVFRRCIDQNRTMDWGKPPFPRVGEEADEESPPPWMKDP